MVLPAISISAAHCTKFNILLRGFHASSARHLNQDWRKKRGLTVNPNVYGPLTNLPDYSFKDNRPTPLGVRQMDRMKRQREYAAKIIEFAGHMDYAVERHKRLMREKVEEEQRQRDEQLKEKGQQLLES